MGPEIYFRFGSMKSAMKKIRFKVITNPMIELDRKCTIIRGLLFSKALYQFGTWRQLNVSEAQRVHKGIMKVLEA